MQIKKGIGILIGAVLSIGIAAYIVYAMLISSQVDPEEKCTAIELNIEENLHSGFITNEIIENELRKANIYPKERLMSDISTSEIESALKKDEFVERVECYKTANGKVVINVAQRTPVIYIIPNKGESYYVDKWGKKIAKSSYPVNMPVATGKITELYAEKYLAKLGAYIVNDEFWNSQIEQIYVKTNSDREYVIDLIPRVGQQIIHLGKLENYKMKLHRLFVFYQKAMSTVGWNKYSEINVEYNGQIICQKQK